MVLFKKIRQRFTVGIRASASAVAGVALLAVVNFADIGRANAEVLFEGYSKILMSGQHVGFVVQRYEFDAKKKEFKSAYYLRTTKEAGDITESLTARANAKLSPISFEFTNLTGTTGKMIDGKFKGEQMTLTIKEQGKSKTVKKKIPKDAFLSNFLAYLMLQGKQGIKSGVKYSYRAIAEEEGEVFAGEAAIVSEEVIKGQPSFKVLNNFKNAQFVSYVTHKGEILSTNMPTQQISTELVATQKEAIGAPGITFNSTVIALLFGDVPKGTMNAVAKGPAQAPTAAKAQTENPAQAPAAKAETPTATPAAKSKKEILESQPEGDAYVSPKLQGVPGGKGVILKGQPAPEDK